MYLNSFEMTVKNHLQPKEERQRVVKQKVLNLAGNKLLA